MARLQKEAAQNEIDILVKKSGEKKKLYGEDAKNYKDLKNQIKIIDAEEKIRLAKEPKQNALNAKAQAIQNTETFRNNELERLKGVQAITVAVNQETNDLIFASNVTASQMNAELQSFTTKTEKENSYARIKQHLIETEAKAEIDNAYLNTLTQFGNLVSALAGKNKTLAISGVVIEQAAAIGRIISSTAVANAKAVAISPATLGQPFVTLNKISAGIGIASSIAAASKAISQIKSAPGGSGGGGGNISGAGTIPGGSATPTQAPIQSGVQVQQTQTIGTTAVNVQNQTSMRAYVVSRDITYSQDRISKIKAAATF